MKTNEPHALAEPPALAPHRYQIFRQERNGVHYSFGSSIASAEEAVEIFLETKPVFEGGGIRLWDHREQRAVAAVDWIAESTAFGFNVRARANAFYDDHLAAIAVRVIEREAFFESLRQRVDLSA